MKVIELIILILEGGVTITQRERDIEVLLKQGLISEEQMASISEFYAKPDADIGHGKDLSVVTKLNKYMPGSIANNIKPISTGKITQGVPLLLPLLGVFFIGVGIIALCAANWDLMWDFSKLVIGLLPLLVLATLLFRLRDHSSDILIHSLTFGVSFATLFGFGMAANLYQSPIDTLILMRYAVLCLLPLTYVYNAYWLAAILMCWILGTSQQDTFILTFLTLISLIPYVVLRLRWNMGARFLLLGHMCILFRILFLIEGSVLVAPFLGIAIIFLASLFLVENVFFRRIIQGILYIFGCVLSFEEGPFDIGYNLLDWHIPSTVMFVIFLCVVVIGFVKVIDVFEDIGDRILYWGFSSLIVLPTVYIIGLDLDISLLATLIMFAIIWSNTARSYRRLNLEGYYLHSISLAVFTVLKVYTWDLYFMSKGVFFITIGVYILTSIYISGRIKRQIQILDNITTHMTEVSEPTKTREEDDNDI